MPLKKMRDRAPSKPSAPSVGENRKEAFWRAVYGIVYYAAMVVIGPLMAIGFVLYTFVDIVYQGVTNKDGLSGGGLGGRVFDATVDLREYVTFGKGSRDSWRR